MRRILVIAVGAVLPALVLASPSPAGATECAACDRYRAALRHDSLADEAAAIGMAALAGDGQQFAVDAELVDAVLRQLIEELGIPDECRACVAAAIQANPRFQLVMRAGRGGTAPPFQMSDGRAGKLINAYDQGVALTNPCSALRPPSSTSDAYVACLAAHSAAAYRGYGDFITGSDARAIANLLDPALGDADVAVIQAYHAAINAGSGAGLAAWARSASKTLGTDQFLTVVQMLGWQMNNGYDFDRANDVGNAGLGGELDMRYVLGASAMLGSSDVRRSDLGATRLIPLAGYTGVGATLGRDGVTRLGQATVVVDQLGANGVGVRARLEVAVASSRLGAIAYASGRVTRTTALLQDDAIRRIGLSVTARVTGRLRLELTGETPIERDAQGRRVYGTVAMAL